MVRLWLEWAGATETKEVGGGRRESRTRAWWHRSVLAGRHVGISFVSVVAYAAIITTSVRTSLDHLFLHSSSFASSSAINFAPRSNSAKLCKIPQCCLS